MLCLYMGLTATSLIPGKPAHSQGNFWPRWLSDDLPNIGVWSFGYPSSSISWRGTSMPLVDRALNALSFFEAEGIGTRPIFFVTHSLGGLLAKQLLRQADGLGKPEWNRVAQQTEGHRFFLSTPNSGSRIANWVMHFKSLVRATGAIEELQDNDPRLRDP